MSGTGPIRIVVVDDHEVVRAGFAGLLATQPDFAVVGTAADGGEAVRVCAEARPDVVLMDVRMPGMDGIEATERIVAGDAERAREAARGREADGSGAARERGGERAEAARVRGADPARGAEPACGVAQVGGAPPSAAGSGVPRILILTTFDLDEHVYDALAAGASGFLLKDVTAERLFDAVRVVASGEGLLAPTVTRRLIAEFARMRPKPPAAEAEDRRLGALTPRETEVLRLIAAGLSNPEIAGHLLVSEETVKTHVSRVLAKLGLRDRTQAVVAAYESGLVVPGGASGG
ncbi:response regulator [Yinghuangia sp. YIM S09857]|uniref:response regulator n=1 Tax=Yinghuangia sp. YIM S09857 TaxID=3436929 RepID=UPI003F52FBEE